MFNNIITLGIKTSKKEQIIIKNLIAKVKRNFWVNLANYGPYS